MLVDHLLKTKKEFKNLKLKGSSVNIPLKFNEQLAEELHKLIIRKF